MLREFSAKVTINCYLSVICLFDVIFIFKIAVFLNDYRTPI